MSLWSNGRKPLAHPGLAWLNDVEEGRAWLARIPAVVNECVEEWSLVVGDAFPYAHTSLALAASLRDETPAVFKIQFPGRETEHEAAALDRWQGRGAVRLLAHDPNRHALLLERCEPGTPLSDLEQDEGLDVFISLLPRLWEPAGDPFRPLADEAEWWAECLPKQYGCAGEPFERVLLEQALEVLETFPSSQGEQVLLSQDLHADNVLRSRREP